MIRALTITATLLVCVGALRAANSAQDPAVSSRTQASEPSTTAASAPTAAPAKVSKPKPKKVWTNEDLGEAGGTISVVGNPQSSTTNKTAQPRQAKSTSTKPPDGTVDAKTLAAVRQQLQKLQSDLALVDQQLTDLKGFNKGDAKGTGTLSTNTFQYSTASVEDQLKQLQAKKANIEAAIDNLLDAARASGIEPGQLR
jgi:hypothetical protein